MCDYQCTSVSIIKLSNRIELKNRFVSVNRIESNYFFRNRNALLQTGGKPYHRSANISEKQKKNYYNLCIGGEMQATLRCLQR